MAYLISNAFFCGISLAFFPMNMNILLIQLFNNVTTVDTMRGSEKRLPCFPPMPRTYKFQNHQNMLWLNNMSQTMGPSLLHWILPIKYNMDGQGLYFPEIPPFVAQDLDIIHKKSTKRTGLSSTEQSMSRDVFNQDVMNLIM